MKISEIVRRRSSGGWLECLECLEASSFQAHVVGPSIYCSSRLDREAGRKVERLVRSTTAQLPMRETLKDA